ncbi:MAG: hypothetical protein HOK24_18815 [Desulfobacula sp.]|uniref:RNA polymerase sigma factor region1.1 domain-containing protein n=1 Tax=Desulfobacula sp. TaxID=2593537 RepID=UPI001ECD6913|nr:hypothetical protein [Desulfobacula sp.]MBT5546513.1 hypothetical protein [Desulfobacula sp.]MBT5973879.1 hypothetical protein [Desulfobacula sp.]
MKLLQKVYIYLFFFFITYSNAWGMHRWDKDDLDPFDNPAVSFGGIVFFVIAAVLFYCFPEIMASAFVYIMVFASVIGMIYGGYIYDSILLFLIGIIIICFVLKELSILISSKKSPEIIIFNETTGNVENKKKDKVCDSQDKIIDIEGDKDQQANPQGFNNLLELAKNGNANAQNKIGAIYYSGEKVPRDSKQAVYWYKKAANNGDADAQKNLGLMYEHGDGGLKTDFTKAVLWYEKSAEQGHLDALEYLLEKYDYGLGVQQNIQKKIYWYKKAAESEGAWYQSICQFELGLLYDTEKEAQQDFKKAAYWYKRAAVGQEHLVTNDNKTMPISDPDDLDIEKSKKNIVISKKELKKLIKKGEKKGFLSFAEINDTINDDLKSLDQLDDIVLQLKELGIKLVDKEKESTAYDSHFEIIGNKKRDRNQQDNSQSFNKFLELADHGDIDAQYSLGMIYEDGKDVTQSFTQSLYWYERAAEGGHPKAQYHLGCIYYIGTEVTIDYQKVVYWYKKAAERGNEFAQFCLGEMYEFGEEVTQDFRLAAHWYKKAAKKGNPDAQRNLGILYDKGKGVPQNHEKAGYWYKKASDRNDIRDQKNDIKKHYKRLDEDADLLKKRDVISILNKKLNYPIASKNLSYSKKNLSNNKFWFEPSYDKFQEDFFIALNDQDKKTIYLFKIPANEFPSYNEFFRDRPNKKRVSITIEGDDTIKFKDSNSGSSGVEFVKYLIQKISYSTKNI